MKARYIYDPPKRMWYKHASSCCGAVQEQKMLYKGKPVKEDFKLQSSTREPIYKTIERKWYQLWKPKSQETIVGYETITTYKEVQFRYYCSDCDKQNKGVWSFKHEGVTEGQSLVSKTKRVSSSLATPAK